MALALWTWVFSSPCPHHPPASLCAVLSSPAHPAISSFKNPSRASSSLFYKLAYLSQYDLYPYVGSWRGGDWRGCSQIRFVCMSDWFLDSISLFYFLKTAAPCWGSSTRWLIWWWDQYEDLFEIKCQPVSASLFDVMNIIHSDSLHHSCSINKATRYRMSLISVFKCIYYINVWISHMLCHQ